MLFENKLIPYKERIYILTLDALSDIDDFFEIISSESYDFKDVLNKDVKKRLSDLFNMFEFPITIICEPYYVDKVYRDEFYRYYSKKHFKISRNTKRLIFIEGKFTKEEFLSNHPADYVKVEKGLIGMVVLKPTQTVGRMLINPHKMKIPKCYLRTTEFEISAFGKLYTLEAFPFSGQDSEVMTCAEVNIWQIMEYFGSRYGDYNTLLPSKLFDYLNETSDVRMLPSDGLTVEQESFVFMRSGLSPKIYYRRSDYEDGDRYIIQELYSDPSFSEILNLYVESGVPILVNLREKNKIDGENHSVTFIGHGYVDFNITSIKQTRCEILNFSQKYIDSVRKKAYNNISIFKSWERYNKYVVMEDHSTPYQIKSLDNLRFDKDGIKWELDSFVAPLYKHIFMLAEDAYKAVIQLIESSYEEIIDTIGSNEIIIRLYLTTSKAYKRFKVTTASALIEKDFFANAIYPKFLWICEYGTLDSYCRHKAIGEFVLDATSSKHNTLEAVISIRHGSSITYREPDDSFENAVVRLDIRIDDEFSMYEQNNLEFVNYEGRQK